MKFNVNVKSSKEDEFYQFMNTLIQLGIISDFNKSSEETTHYRDEPEEKKDDNKDDDDSIMYELTEQYKDLLD